MAKRSSRLLLTNSRHTSTVKGIRLVFLVLILFVLILPNSSHRVLPLQHSSVSKQSPDNMYITSSNLIKINLPYQVESIAVGTIQIGSGVGYVHNGIFYFTNPINQTKYQTSIGEGEVFHKTLLGCNIDNDSYTEFMFMKQIGNFPKLVLVNCDNDTIRTYDFGVFSPDEIITGDFNGDGQIDVAVYNDTNIEMKDLSSGNSIGSYAPLGTINRALAGNFTSDQNDEIAIVYSTIIGAGGLPDMTVEIITGTGLFIRNVIYSATRGIDAIKYRTNDILDCIAVTGMVFSGSLSYSPIVKGLYANLTEAFSKTFNEYNSEFFVKRGNFSTIDNVDDLALVPAMGGTVLTISGLDGSIISRSIELFLPADRFAFDTAALDADNCTDITLEGPHGLLTFIRGDTGETGYEESRISGPFDQVLTYDLNLDGKSDTIILAWRIAVLLSDTSVPDVTIYPLYPAHPTVFDSYLKIEVSASDESGILEANIYIFEKPFDFPIKNRMTSGPNNKFFYFITNLHAGPLYYFIEVIDPYLNTYYYGNITHPHIINVEGHFVFGSQINATVSEARRHIFDYINDTAGNKVFLCLQKDSSNYTELIHVFASNGTLLERLPITNISGSFLFEVYSANLDNDIIRDFIVIGFNQSMTRFWLFNGSTLSSQLNASFPIALQNEKNVMMVFDDDGDALDEFHFISGNTTYSHLHRLESNLQEWTNVSLSNNGLVISTAVTTLTGNTPQLALLRENRTVEIFQANTLSLLKTLWYTSPGGTANDIPVSIHAFANSTHLSGQFVAVYHGWDGETPTNYICFIDYTTSYVGEPPAFQKLGDHITKIVLFDTDADGTDEFFFYDEAGNVSYYLPRGPGIVNWSSFVSESDCIDALVLDFDGDSENELVLSTSDKKLVAVEFDGSIGYSATVGLIYHSFEIGNVDAGSGSDFVAFPVFESEFSFGAIRELDLLYALNVSFAVNASTVLQGGLVDLDARIQNVFGESVGDATVSVEIAYIKGTTQYQQIVGLVYNSTNANYTALVSANWPIGPVNLTLTVHHEIYTDRIQEFPDILRVYSPLTVTAFFQSKIDQNEDLDVKVTITDLLGNSVSNASVTVELNGSTYNATKIGDFYLSTITNITLAPGKHILSIRANHLYATAEANQTDMLSVMANSLNISHSSYLVVEQDTLFQTWVNVSDNYGHLLTNGTVSVEIEGNEYLLHEIVPGSYLLNETAAFPIGNHSITIEIYHPFVYPGTYGNYYIGVQGDLNPTISYSKDVAGGSNFTVSVFVYDFYGSIPQGAWALIEFNGKMYSAIYQGSGEFRRNITANLSVGQQSFKIYVGALLARNTSSICDLFVYSTAHLSFNSSKGWTFQQGTTTILTVNLTDWLNTPIPDATLSTLSPERIVFTNNGDGTYSAELKTTDYSPGEYTLLVSVEHDYLTGGPFGQNITVLGRAIISVTYDTPIRVGESVQFMFTVTDLYSNPITLFNWSFTFQDVNLSGTHSGNNTVIISVIVTSPVGESILSFNVESQFVQLTTKQTSVPVRSVANVEIHAPTNVQSYVQGEYVPFVVSIYDANNHTVPDISARIVIQESAYMLTDLKNGTYTDSILTAGWSPGIYPYVLTIEHPYLDYNRTVYGNITILGRVLLELEVSPESPMQGDILTVTILATDQYGTPLSNLQITIEFQNQIVNVMETDKVGIYTAQLVVSEVGHGDFPMAISAVGVHCLPTTYDAVLFIGVRPPDLSMNYTTFAFNVGISFLASLIGLFIYFKTLSAFRIGKETLWQVHKTIRRIDKIYLVIALINGLVIFHSFLLANVGQYNLAVAESILLLGISILLYGLWLYRDVTSAILQTRQINKKRMGLGFWHLFFVPLVILQIFTWGNQIEWFQYYVLQKTFYLGPLALPTILLTIFVTYISSIVLVVLNLYRELGKGLSKLERMETSATPIDIIQDEQIELSNKISSSIRIKFFMFLIVLAGTTVTTLDFLRSYSLGVIVLLPVLFLVIIPYLSSKLVKTIDRAIGSLRSKESRSDLWATADVRTEHVTPPAEEDESSETISGEESSLPDEE